MWHDLTERVEQITSALRRLIVQPRSELNRWQMAVRFAYDLGRYGARQLRQDRAPQMAAALAFQTLFALLPVLVVGTVFVRAVRGVNQFEEQFSRLLVFAGMDQLRIIPPGSDEASAASISLATWLEQLIAHAAQTDLAAIGWVGLVVVVYAAISIMVTIENSFNTICRAPEGRSWTRRVPMYWFILTLGPVVIGVTMYFDSELAEWTQSLNTWAWVVLAGKLIWSFVQMWVFMAAVYLLVPNTTINVRPALIGAAVAAVLLEIGKRTMGAYLQNAVSLGQLFGSLGLIPLFMYWVYLMWLVVLFGLEVGATLQLLESQELHDLEERPQLAGLVDPASIVAVLEYAAQQFREGRSITARRAAEALSLPETSVARMFTRLSDAGYLHRLDREDRVSLARPPTEISVVDVLDLGYAMSDEHGNTHRSPLLGTLRDSQRDTAHQMRLL